MTAAMSLTTPYRQLILPGDQGADVKAVKRAMTKMNIRGAGTLIINNQAGSAFVTVLNTTLRQHGLKADSRYGPGAHAIIAPHFDLYGISLYRKAAIRDRTEPPPEIGHQTAKQAAQRLITHATAGRYHADNPGDLADLKRTANGDPVWSQLGRWVYIDHRPLELVVWLIETKGHKIGTYAICSDHHNDGPRGHAGGYAIDVSAIDGHGIGASGSHAITLAVAQAIRFDTPDILRPHQLICDGAEGVRYSDIAACCLPYETYYDSGTLRGHRDHCHAGF